MTDVVYSKCSTERSSKYRIVTKIIEKNNKKAVTKEAVTKEAIHHIRAMLENYNGLSSLYEDFPIRVLEGKKITDSIVEFPFVYGETLEDKFENLVKSGEEEKILDWIQIIADSFYKNPNLVQFKISEQFSKIFGNQIFSEEKSALPISNLDSIFANFILEEDGLIMIDYEWVFDFQIPVDFILYRALFHSPAIQKMQQCNLEKAYDIAGVRTSDKEQYFIMEENFQKYVRKGQIDLEEVYRRINNHCYPLKLNNESKIFNDYEVYFDEQCILKAHTLDTSITIKMDVPKDACKIKFVLNHFNGIYKILKIIGIKNGLEEDIIITESNSNLNIIDDYYFLNRPEIVVKNNNYETVYMEYKILEQNINCMDQLITALIQANQYKNAAESARMHVEEYKKGMEEYMSAYHILEKEINQIHGTLIWKIGDKIGKITKR